MSGQRRALKKPHPLLAVLNDILVELRVIRRHIGAQDPSVAAQLQEITRRAFMPKMVEQVFTPFPAVSRRKAIKRKLRRTLKTYRRTR